MAEEFKIAWAVYAGGVVILLAAGWWFMRNWSWSWVRNLLLLEAATVLLVPARGTADGPLTPVLPLFVYQTIFEEEGATPEVAASLVFAAAGALSVMLIVGIITLMVRRRKDRPMTESDQY